MQMNNKQVFLDWLDYAYQKIDRPCRKLTPNEIEQLQKAGNQADNWDLIQISDDVSLDSIVQSSFSGNITLLGPSLKKCPVLPGFYHNSGIYNSRVNNAIINMAALVMDCELLSGYIIEEGSVLFANGPIFYSTPPKVIGIEIAPGNETGGREIRLWPDITFHDAEQSVLKTKTKKEAVADEESLKRYFGRIKGAYGIIGSSSCLIKNKMISHSFFGPRSCIEGSESIEHSVIVSSAELPVQIKQGAMVSHSLIHQGCDIESQAIVDHSLLCEVSGASRHGKVTQSVLGPNTHVAEGEVTASFVGPFVGFHHQSLLISAIWPEGKGNIAYGANVGSNHTGKAPDQEILPGEGSFYGLGCNIKFPANYANAPYSLFATAVLTLPQKLDFPFSLIQQPVFTDPTLPPAFNELRPGWVFHYNSYLIYRSAIKFGSRNKAPSYKLEAEILREEIIEKVLIALDSLESPVKIEPFYTSDQIKGLGKNFITDKSRKQGIEAYCFILGLFALKEYWKEFTKIQPGQMAFEKDSLVQRLFERFGFDIQKPKRLLQSYLEYEREFLNRIRESRKRDFLRGRKICEDYDKVHEPLEKDQIILSANADFEHLEKEISHILANQSL